MLARSPKAPRISLRLQFYHSLKSTTAVPRQSHIAAHCEDLFRAARARTLQHKMNASSAKRSSYVDFAIPHSRHHHFFLINQLGGRHIQQSHQNDLFDDEFGKSTVFNIAFRIIAPVVVLIFFGLICFFVGLRFEFSYLLISGETYWALRILAWALKRRTVRSNIAMVLVQAAVSLLLSWYLFTAIGNDPVQSLAPDVGDVSLEFIILAITVLFYILAESPMFRKERSPKSPLMEKQLFAIDKLCRKSMPDRYKQDPALLILFYTFALIEDTYRPSWIRQAERIAYHVLPFKKPRTFGLMQTTSDHPLSDEESTACAYGIVSKIYDEFIETYPEFTIDPMNEEGHAPCLISFQNGYIYKLASILTALGIHASVLYGKYCGTYLLDIYSYFNTAKDFVLWQYNISRFQNIQVAHSATKRWAPLAVNGWCPLSLQRGFACQGGEDAARALVGKHSLSQERLQSHLIKHDLNSCVYLAYWGVDGTVIALSEDSEEEKVSAAAEELDLSIESIAYHFEEFASNPRGFLDTLLVKETHG